MNSVKYIGMDVHKEANLRRGSKFFWQAGDGVHDSQGWNGFAGDTQAVCGFRWWASKRSPFFQRINVMAAILRARVRRAISGRIPLATKRS